MTKGTDAVTMGLLILGGSAIILLICPPACIMQRFSGAGVGQVSRHAASLFFDGTSGAAGLREPLRLLTWEISPNPKGGNIGKLLSIGSNGKVDLLTKVHPEPKGRCWLPWTKNTTHLYYSCTISDTDDDHKYAGKVCIFDRVSRAEVRCFEAMGLSHDITWSNRHQLFLVATTKEEKCGGKKQPQAIREACEAINRTKVKYDVMRAYDEHGKQKWAFDTRTLLGEEFRWKYRISTADRLEATHINAQIFSPVDDAFYLSSRGLSTLFKINLTTKKVIWGVGLHGTLPVWGLDGKILTAPSPFLGQHGVALLPGEVVVTFDNGVFPPADRQNPSRLVAFQVRDQQAHIVWRYTPHIAKQDLYNRAVTGSAAPLPAVFGSATAAFGPVEPPTIIPPSRKYLVGTHDGDEVFVSNLDCWFVYGGTSTMDAPMVKVTRLGPLPQATEIVHESDGHQAEHSETGAVYVAVVVPYFDCLAFRVEVRECGTLGGAATILDATINAAPYWQTSLVRLPPLPLATRVKVRVVVEATAVEVVWDAVTGAEVASCRG